MNILDTSRRKILASIFILLIGILAGTSLLNRMLEQTIVSDLDRQGDRYYNAALGRAIYTFAVVRGLNGLISVIQGTDVAVSPAGIGLSLSVGEILDPINDLVERFSWVMLVSTTSLGAQKVLMEMGEWFGLTVLLTLSMFLILIGIWIPPSVRFRPDVWGYKLVLISLIIRFGIPAVAIASNLIYDRFLSRTYDHSITSLEEASRELKETGLADADTEARTDEQGYLERLKEMYQNVRAHEGLRRKLQFLRERITDYAEYMVDLIIVFMVQTVLIPVAVLWILVRLIGYICGNPLLFVRQKK